ncbi:hypothetical protein [Actinoplanes sp. NPDC049802]|uniref:hypothetical protein n=1 Tax=Actinoplanes sp. NPDC049802 TaxID=3154742 RepID=UPI0033C88048
MGKLTTATAAMLVISQAAILACACADGADIPAGPRLDLVVLLVTDGGPNTTAIEAHLRTDGIPYRTVDLRRADRPAITAAFLADADGPNFQAVVLPAADALAAGSPESAALRDYERRYAIRQVDAFQWPGPAVGLRTATYAGPLDGSAATVTAAGRSGPFGYLRGPVPFEDLKPGTPESHGYLSRPAGDGARLTPLLEGTVPGGGDRGVLAGVHRTADDREELFLTFAFNAAQQQFRLLAPGIVDWVTRGVHLGYRRNYLSVHVDDVLLGDRRWSVTGDCTPGEDCTGGQETADIRMTPADVAFATRWQTANGFTLDLVFNGAGSVEAAQNAGGRDDLTEALTAAAGRFRWANHTYSHQYLGCVQDLTVTPWRCRTDGGDTVYVGADLIGDEITRNIAWGRDHGLDLRAGELVTGEHSGLRNPPRQPAGNPNLDDAVDDAKVRWLAADASRMPQPERVGDAWTVPRYPIDLFFNVGTAAEEIDEYNVLYAARCIGGPAGSTCRPPLDPATGYTDVVVPTEARAVLARMQGNDPRPHYVHQANLAEERLLYPLLDRVMEQYRRLYADTAPIVCQRMADNGVALRRQARWAEAVAAGKAGAFLAGGRVFAHAPDGVPVPLTVPAGSTVDGAAFGDAYAGTQSAWTPAGREVTLP